MKKNIFKTKESTIQKGVIKYLQTLENMGHLYFFRSGAGAVKIKEKDKKDRYFKTGKKGCPDITVCYRGGFYGLEIKSPTGRQTDRQKIAQKAIYQSGGLYYVIRDVLEVEELFS